MHKTEYTTTLYVVEHIANKVDKALYKNNDWSLLLARSPPQY